MQSFDLSKLSEYSNTVNQRVQEFADGLSKLANHMGGQDGVNEIFTRVRRSMDDGIPMEESLVEAYRHLREKLV